jgi:dynein heavy chain 2
MQKNTNLISADKAKETQLMVGALRMNTLSKLTYDDAARFKQLVTDVFPNLPVDGDEIDYKTLEGRWCECSCDVHLCACLHSVQTKLTVNYASSHTAAAIRQAMLDLHLQVIDTQVHKILQIYEALNQRMGCVIVGPSGCGKSVMLKVLHRALSAMGKRIVKHTMNPKALRRGEFSCKD